MSVLWRDQRRAGLLMGAYCLLALAVGPVIFVRFGTDSYHGLVGWTLTAFLAWRVTRGGRVSRTLLIVAAEAGFITAVILLAIRFSWSELGLLGACGTQTALLLSPAVYERTRSADPGDADIALWRRVPAPILAALVAGAVLGLAGAAASAAVISSRVRGYHADTVRLIIGHPASLTLGAGRYGAFGECVDEWGCAQVAPRGLSVVGAVSGTVATVADDRFDNRTDAGQQFDRDLTFTVPVPEVVRFALNVNPGQPVLIAPAQDEAGLINHEIAAAAGCGLLLLASLAALAWPVAPRAARRGVPAAPSEPLAVP